MSLNYSRKRNKRNLYVKKYNKRLKKDRYGELTIRVCALILVIALLFGGIRYYRNKKAKINIKNENLSAFNIAFGVFTSLKELSEKYSIEFPELLTYYGISNEFFPNEASVYSKEQIEQNFIIDYSKVKAEYDEKEIEPYYNMIENILSEIKYFPIPNGYFNEETKESEYMYGNSWGSKREYGGDRIHKGTDITDRENIRGRIPIVSMTDGKIENIGWNELGGYRIGVRTENDTYYYYAHLAKFKDGLEKGAEISAGDVIGYMGDTGYSKKEGETGNFIVHLHVGISPKLFKDEFWINPYVFLRNIEGSKVDIE